MLTDRSNIEHVPASTLDITADRLDVLHDLFPEAFTQWQLDLDKLADATGLPTIKGDAERYSFTWAGKRDALRLLRTPSSALALIKHFELDLYENSVVPIALAHRYMAISLKPGGRVLDLLTRKALQGKT
jgi:hypothetical protein